MEYIGKRKDYLSWDQYFMGVAQLSALRSKDPNTQVGACVVSPAKRILAIGYNGLPRNISDDEINWSRHNKKLTEQKYPYIIHAEVNAVLNATAPLKNSTMYVNEFPCHDCAKVIIQSEIIEIVYLTNKYIGSDSDILAKKMLIANAIKWRDLAKFTVDVQQNDHHLD